MQSTLRHSISILVIILFSSCQNTDKSEQLQLETLTASLEKSNALIAANSHSEMLAFKNRLSNPYENTEAAKDYFSKAEAVNKLTDSVMEYLDAIKAKLNSKEQISVTNNDWSALYKTLKDYRTNILQLDTNASKEFGNNLEIINPYFDSTNNDSQNFISRFFNNSTTNSALATVTTFQNNIFIAQSDLIHFVNSSCVRTFCGFNQILPLVSQDKRYVKAGENIEITAGIGAFTTTVKPIIKVNGDKVNINAEGFSVYKFKASPKLGQHSIPLEVEFFGVDGRKSSLVKQMKYTVVNVDSSINK